MKFELLDKIESLSDTRIVASKSVSLAEEYLADHFPTFPVLPGVMMLEAAVQAACWLAWRRTDFAKSMAVLKAARNVRYGNFVAPGQTLAVEVEVANMSESAGTFKATGRVGSSQAFTGRIELALFDLAEKSPELAGVDEKLRAHNRARWNVLAAHGVTATGATSI